MKKAKYTEEEKAFIKKWGHASDEDYDNSRLVYFPETRKRITQLELAKMNKRATDKIKAYKKLHNLV